MANNSILWLAVGAAAAWYLTRSATPAYADGSTVPRGGMDPSGLFPAWYPQLLPELFPGAGSGQVVRPDWTDPELLPPPDPDTVFASNIFRQFDPVYDGPPRYW